MEYQKTLNKAGLGSFYLSIGFLIGYFFELPPEVTMAITNILGIILMDFIKYR